MLDEPLNKTKKATDPVRMLPPRVPRSSNHSTNRVLKSKLTTPKPSAKVILHASELMNFIGIDTPTDLSNPTITSTVMPHSSPTLACEGPSGLIHRRSPKAVPNATASSPSLASLGLPGIFSASHVSETSVWRKAQTVISEPQWLAGSDSASVWEVETAPPEFDTDDLGYQATRGASTFIHKVLLDSNGPTIDLSRRG